MSSQSAAVCQLIHTFLLITDRPAPPSNLTLLSSTVSWIPPFSLSGVTLSYFVNVTNLNTSGVIRSGGLRTPSFNFSGTEDGSPCDVYQFTVTVRNKAGWSDPSNFTFSLPSCKLHPQNLCRMSPVILSLNSCLEIQKSCMYNKNKDHTTVLCLII